MSQATLPMPRSSDVTPRRPRVAENAVVGVMIFVVAEVMFFASLIAAFSIVKAGANGPWPPPGQPRLPVADTAINTAALLASGVVMFFAHREYRRDPVRARWPLLVSILLGTFFVAFQGMEWLDLIREGLTMTTSQHGGFFYLIVGAHSLHVVSALIVLAVIYGKLRRATLTPATFAAARIFWYFVVGLWPVLYWRVYL